MSQRRDGCLNDQGGFFSSQPAQEILKQAALESKLQQRGMNLSSAARVLVHDRRAAPTDLSYSEFKSAVRSEAVESVIIDSERIEGTLRNGSGVGAGLFSFSKSKARITEGEQSRVTFDDIGGAGEAGVPFFSLSSAEFVEMFVGVGASRVRDLFVQAKKKAPAINFIDEIDAIGGRRAIGASLSGGHDEREQALNRLLAEMDGFQPSTGLMPIAATNRPEVLEAALIPAHGER